MIIDDLNTKYTLAKNWVLRADPYYKSKEYSIYDINSRLTLYVTRSCYTLLKIFSQRAISFSELHNAVEKKRVTIDWSGFENLCEKIAPLKFLIQSETALHKSDNMNDWDGVNGYDVPVTSTPVSAEIHFTHKCNLKCQHCFQESSPTSHLYKELEASQWIYIFKQIELYKMCKITLSGGEIMSYPHFSKVFNEIVNYKINYVVLTNGTLVDDSNMEALSKPNVALTISLDGHSSEIHDRLRGRGVFDKVIRNIKALVENGAKVSLAYTINSYNYLYLKDAVELALLLGVRGMLFSFTSETGRAKENLNLILTASQREVAKKDFARLEEEYGDMLNLSLMEIVAPKSDMELSDKVYCAAGTNHVGISSDGKLYPCVYSFGYEELVMGDLTKENLKDIWENREKWKMFRGGFSLEKIDTCSTCALNRKCSMRNCRLRNYAEGKSFYNKPIECAIDCAVEL